VNDRDELREGALEGFDRSLQPHRRGDVLPGDVVPVRVRQVAYEFSLRAAVAFAKRVQRVDLAELVRCADAERRRGETGQRLSRASCTKIGAAAPSMYA
jgi:hypothetical protein